MKIYGLILLLLFSLSSCISIRHAGFEIKNYKKLKTANLVAEGEKREKFIPSLTIVDSGIFKILDSIIQITANCRNYSPKLKTIFAFTIVPIVRNDNNKLFYRIFIELSVKNEIERDKDLKGFYYKNLLFIVHEGNFSELVKSKLFYKNAGCELKIHAWDFKINKAYMPFAIVEEINGEYKMDDNLCSCEVYINDRRLLKGKK
jgi:hypothetical protein